MATQGALDPTTASILALRDGISLLIIAYVRVSCSETGQVTDNYCIQKKKKKKKGGNGVEQVSSLVYVPLKLREFSC